MVRLGVRNEQPILWCAIGLGKVGPPVGGPSTVPKRQSIKDRGDPGGPPGHLTSPRTWPGRLVFSTPAIAKMTAPPTTWKSAKRATDETLEVERLDVMLMLYLWHDHRNDGDDEPG